MSIDICPDYGDSVSELTEENEKLTARIAELEGKLAELIEAADKMYDVTEYILGGDTVEMFYCREIAEEERDVLKGE